ncbi:MAG: Spy/CpxP family protein refolding chaperone [Candidatus Marinimicrobia bacterium]|nr:Spy/CpxP family protein refolding chaperone [Candidatus Neomarinimicrobiota bacterium]
MKCLTTVIILLAIPALVIAGPKRVVKKHMMTGKHMEMAEKLNLNDEQKEQMHQLRVKHQKAIIPITADLKLARLELEELISSDGSSKKIDAAIGKINDLKGKFLELRVKHRIAMRNILTDDQKAMIKYQKAGCPRGPGKKGSKMGHGMMGEFFMPDWEEGAKENIEVEVIDESIAH